ncbi:MAG: hypothetical protein M3Z64_01280, partial [Verrucomicrobiota bacterium]|nr:hypothetical protein [Verrucomicrobiota bacterium]
MGEQRELVEASSSMAVMASKPRDRLVSTSNESEWKAIAVQNLTRSRASGTYFARFRVGKKLIWKSLKTTVFSVAKQRLADMIREHRAKVESVTPFANGKMNVGDAAEV